MLDSPEELYTNKGRIKLCFFLSKTHTPFEGVARPFINWVVQLLREEKHEIYFILLDCSMKLKQFIENNIVGVNLKSVDNLGEIVNYLTSTRPDILITDDYFPRLRLITKIKSKIQIRTCIYVQVLHGIHSIGESFNLGSISLHMKILYGTLKLIPFNFLKIPYKRSLLRHDIIIANSQITATLLHTLYGIEPHEIIYPPVNTRIFKFHSVVDGKNQVLLYLGSHPDDTNDNFIKKICETVENRGFKILVLGGNDLQRKLRGEFNIQQFLDVSDEELAGIYSECKLTICPQKWETFGYVVAESICCGTPVLAFNCMGLAEIITQSQMGYLANNEKEFIKKIECFRSKGIKEDNNPSYLWDTIQSSKKMENTLENAIQ